MHIFQSLVLPLVEKELVSHEGDIGRLILVQIHGLINKFIAHVDKQTNEKKAED